MPISLRTCAAFLLALIALPATAGAQGRPVNGMRPVDLRAHAFVDVTIVVAPGHTIEHATLLVRDGVIEAVGKMTDVQVPDDARVWDTEGLTIYPGLIESALLVEAANRPEAAGLHWNERIVPQIDMASEALPPDSLRSSLRSLGFTAAAVYPDTGAFRGSGVVLGLAENPDHVVTYEGDVAMSMAFDYGGGFGGGRGGGVYPNSLMGSIAQIRQTLLDAQWHAACQRVYAEHPLGNEPPAPSEALDALKRVIEGEQPVLFDVRDETAILRAARIMAEFSLKGIILGCGTEFARLDEVAALNLPIIVPIEFPKRPEVNDPSQAEQVSLRAMQEWEQAPTNARRLLQAGLNIALTTHRLRDRKIFFDALHKSIEQGLTEDQALAALTTVPARLLGLDDVMGSIQPGKIANLVLVEGSLFDSKPKIRDVWVNGWRHEIKAKPIVTLASKGTITTSNGFSHDMQVDTEKSTISITLPPKKEQADDAAEPEANDDNGDEAADEAKPEEQGEAAPRKKPEPKPTVIKAKAVTMQNDRFSAVIDAKPFDAEGFAQISGVIVGDKIAGSGVMPDGSHFTFTYEAKAEQDGDEADKPKDENDKDNDADDDNGEKKPSDEDAEWNKLRARVSGTWRTSLKHQGEDQPLQLQLVVGEDGNVLGSVSALGEVRPILSGTLERDGSELRLNVASPDLEQPITITAEPDFEAKLIRGSIVASDIAADFEAARAPAMGAKEEDDEKEDEEKEPEPPAELAPQELTLPLGEYGVTAPPPSVAVLVTNATIWTCGPAGVIENGYLAIREGKIVLATSQERNAKGFQQELREAGEEVFVIDGRGKHITPGLIDCHSHTGIQGGVNEFMQVNTAEVRIRDVLDPDDINWYRELAGGCVTVNQLHGSANPIGGQNCVTKARWGSPMDAWRIPDSQQGIKFALGENVKRSQGRYPNTRMGVETMMRDAFTAAQDYDAKWQRYLKKSADEKARTMPPRRDLELDALVEILHGERFVHCHSYRQDEILALIRLADSFGFHVGTFQHILEGYKVADAIAKHGAGGSSFADWWAYKVEVMDAIPYNAALMTEVGVLMSLNSDSDELARRLNTEAAKAVRYGGMVPSEALKLVTINPATQLGVDHRTGSLEPGKDGDFVIWSGDPLSTYTRCEQTWIEGARYFSLDSDKEMRETVQRERSRLIQKILKESHGDRGSAGSSGPGGGRPGGGPPRGRMRPPMWNFVVEAIYDEMLRSGRTLDEHRPGECGCGELDFDRLEAFFAEQHQ